jgi:hypothetical protein
MSRRCRRRRSAMLRSEVHCIGAVLALAVSVQGLAFGAEPAFRYSAPIEIRKAAPFVQLALPPSAYAHAAQPELRDLRVVDARGGRVPFALLGARSELQTTEHRHDAVLYALPARPGADGNWQAPVEIVVEGDRVRVRKGGGPRGASLATAAGVPSGGWIVDLGERKPEDPLPRWLRLQWSGPAQFTAGYRVETSDDLRTWRPGGAGQLMALASTSGPLTQPSVALPDSPGRFVRLVWSDAAAAPMVTVAQVVASEHSTVALEAPADLVFAPSAPPTDKATPPERARGALYFDLGGALPLLQVELRFETGTRVAPVRVQGRNRADEAWRDLAEGVFYRLERSGSVDTAPPLALRQSVRFVRVVPDERAAPLAAEGTHLAVQAQLARLVFALQGQAPFALLAGSVDATAGGLPVATLVPNLDDERPRFGQAALGGWSESDVVARGIAAERRQAQWRPWLLWAVLLAGVAGLGFMVWRLARGAGAPSA